MGIGIGVEIWSFYCIGIKFVVVYEVVDGFYGCDCFFVIGGVGWNGCFFGGKLVFVGLDGGVFLCCCLDCCCCFVELESVGEIVIFLVWEMIDEVLWVGEIVI